MLFVVVEIEDYFRFNSARELSDFDFIRHPQLLSWLQLFSFVSTRLRCNLFAFVDAD